VPAIVVNGRAAEVAAATVEALVAELGLRGERVAVERNRELVPRRRWAETPVAPGDQIEIVQMVGGGGRFA
jgi:thiamine biosynthesis protein ThiS